MKVAIIGLGAAGLMSASVASKDNEVYIFEKNEKAGKKIFITGKGRCNMTNACDIFEFKKNIITNSKFLSHALSEFDNHDIIDYFEKNGLETKIERGNRVFPKYDKAYLVTECLLNIIENNKAKIYYNHEVIDIKGNDNGTIGIEVKNTKSNKVEKFNFDKVIICTGGKSYKSTGSTGDGYKFANKLNIATTKLYPSLVPLKVKQIDEMKLLESLALKNVSIKIVDSNNKVLYKDFGEMMFRDNCLDGPIIISASSFIADKVLQGFTIYIDLKPALDYEKLENRILRDINEKNKINIKQELESLLPIKFINVFINRLKNILNYNDDIDINLKTISNMTKAERKTIVNLLKNFSFDIVDTKDFDTAIVTKGGIDINEINNKTMQSKKNHNIYFAGELLDLDALTGGFNLSIAFITGYIAGELLD